MCTVQTASTYDFGIISKNKYIIREVSYDSNASVISSNDIIIKIHFK